MDDGDAHESDAPEGGAHGSSEPWTRAAVARVLECSVATVRRLEESGRLTPERGPKDTRLFDREQVLALKADLARERTERSAAAVEQVASIGEQHGVQQPPRAPMTPVHSPIAAAAFEAFEDGCDAVETVIQLKLDPNYVEQLHAQWARMREMPTFSLLSERIEWLELGLRQLEGVVLDRGYDLGHLRQQVHEVIALVHMLLPPFPPPLPPPPPSHATSTMRE